MKRKPVGVGVGGQKVKNFCATSSTEQNVKINLERILCATKKLVISRGRSVGLRAYMLTAESEIITMADVLRYSSVYIQQMDS